MSYPSYIVVNGDQTDLLVQRMSVRSDITIQTGGSRALFPGNQRTSLVAISECLPDVFSRDGAPVVGGCFVLSFRVAEREEYEGSFFLSQMHMSPSEGYTFIFEGTEGDSKVVSKSNIPVAPEVPEIPEKRHDRWNLVK